MLLPIGITIVLALSEPATPPSAAMSTFTVVAAETFPLSVAVSVAVPAARMVEADDVKVISVAGPQLLLVESQTLPCAHWLVSVQATQVEAALQLGVAPLHAPLTPLTLSAGLQATHEPLSHAGVAAGQPLFTPFWFCESRQTTQVFDVVSQMLVGAAQLALVVQPTQTLFWQNGAESAHWASAVHCPQ